MFVARSALGVEVEVSREGMRLRKGTEDWVISAVGLGGQPECVGANRVEVDRGWAREWVVNGPKGLEQGWNAPRRPEALASGNGWRVALRQGGALRAKTVSEDGLSVTVADRAGAVVFRCCGLNARDRRQ
ncbi:MAG: hypothetical protein QME60_00230 [Verrucomicrobiota bacterium]|nr:hypothetical protein [Verrucomicrobiota bacterium]